MKEFKNLKFNEEKHEYKVDDKVLPSVSSLLKDLKNEFDVEEVAIRVAAREGISPEEIKHGWRQHNSERINIGNIAHDFGENYFYNRNLVPETNQQKAIVNFWNELNPKYLPLHAELKMYCKWFAGTSDLILINQETRGLIVGDYKTNADLFKNYDLQTLKKPFSDMLDMPFNHYQLQLSLYQIMLELVGFRVEDRMLIWLKEDGTYEVYHTKDFTNRLREYYVK